MYFNLVMEAGYVGVGKSCDMVRYFEGDDIFGVLARSRHTPRLKKKESGGGIKLIKEISLARLYPWQGAREKKSLPQQYGFSYYCAIIPT